MILKYIYFVDINTDGVMFTQPESFIKKNYLTSDQQDDKDALKKIFQETVLINLRTYDDTSLILYANDHLNNFMHISLYNGTEVVYMFNHGNEIQNITVKCAELNSSVSIQLAITRTENSTTLHVNEYNNSIPLGVLLLEDYSNKPWTNPEKGIIRPI